MKQVDGRVAHMTDTTRHQSWQSTSLPVHAGSIPGSIYCHGDAPPLNFGKGSVRWGGGVYFIKYFFQFGKAISCHHHHNRDFKIGDYGQRTTNEDERELGRGALRMLKTKHNYVVRCVPARYDSFPGFSRSL